MIVYAPDAIVGTVVERVVPFEVILSATKLTVPFLKVTMLSVEVKLVPEMTTGVPAEAETGLIETITGDSGVGFVITKSALIETPLLFEIRRPYVPVGIVDGTVKDKVEPSVEFFISE